MRISVLYAVFASMAISFCGCTHTTYIADSKNPEVEFSEDGGLMWRGRFIELEELPELLEDADVDKKSQIDIRVPERIRSLKAPRVLLFILRRAGYTRRRKSSSFCNRSSAKGFATNKAEGGYGEGIHKDKGTHRVSPFGD